MNILSIQSTVAYGHVGNSAAVFPLQRLGFSVWPVITVHFSNNPSYGHFGGSVLPAADVADVIAGLDRNGILADCDAVLSGYMGDVPVGEVILDAVARVRRAAPEPLYCCDPVMGDVDSGFYVRAGLPDFIRDRAVPAADIVTPNQFELEFLTGAPATDLDSVLLAADRLRATGPDIVVVTSLRRTDNPLETVEVLVVSGEGAWLVGTPLLPARVNGTGDVIAALFLAHFLKGRDAAMALSRAVASVFAIMEETVKAGTREIQLIAAQDVIADPPDRFPVTRLR